MRITENEPEKVEIVVPQVVPAEAPVKQPSAPANDPAPQEEEKEAA